MIPGITKSYYGCSSTLSIQRLSTVNCEKHCVKDKFFAHSSVCESDNVTKWIWTKITGKRTTALRQYQLICAMSHAVFQTVPREVEPWTALYSVWETVSLSRSQRHGVNYCLLFQDCHATPSAPLILSQLDHEMENSLCVFQFLLHMSCTQFKAKKTRSNNLSTSLYVRHVLKVSIF